jgi:class 3 adenylate cyclase
METIVLLACFRCFSPPMWRAIWQLTGEEEEGRQPLTAIRRELGDPKAKEHRGRIVMTTGGTFLIEFASDVGAVRCAVRIQRGMVARTPALRSRRRKGGGAGGHTVATRTQKTWP